MDVFKVARSLNNEDISELRAILVINPYQADKIQFVMNAVSTLFNERPTRENALMLLGKKNFKELLLTYNIKNISDETLIKLRKYIIDVRFNPKLFSDRNNIELINRNCQKMCRYVLDVYKYAIKLRHQKILKTFAQMLNEKEISINTYLGLVRKLHESQENLEVFDMDIFFNSSHLQSYNN